MKIGVCSNYYPPMERGGAELVAERIADELSRRGHHVFVVTTELFLGLTSLRPTLTEQDIERVYRFYPLNLYHISHADRVPFPLRVMWHLIDLCGPFPHRFIERLLADEEPDVVLTHNLKGLGVSVARLIQQAGIRHFHTIHDVQLTIPSGVLMYGSEQTWLNMGRVRKFYEALAKRAIGTPDVIISPSEFLSTFYQERGFFLENDVHVIPNPAPKWRLSVERSTHAPAGALRLLFVGQLEKHKGIDLLLHAVQQLHIPYELHIAGEGSCAQEVAVHAERNPSLFFHGFVSLEHIRELMSRMDVTVLPSLCYENSPTVLYESFQIGTPVIASRIGGIPERVQHGVNGLLVEPASVKALVEVIEAFAKQRESFWQRAQAIKEQASVFSIERYVDQLESLF